MEICIVGRGSIGNRHANIFLELGCKITFFRTYKSTIKNKGKSFFEEVSSFSKLKKKKFGLIVICNPTSLHYKTLKKFSNLSRNFLLEKPISNSLEEIDLIFKLVKLKKLRLFSGYMMRFDPRVIFISKILKKKSIIYSNFVWHTYFPNWHPYENYRNSYAIKKKMGGGVIKTCSHEVDLSHLLNGRVKEIMCLQRPNKLSNEVEESVIINLIHSNGSLSKIDLDFTTKKIRRYFVIFTKKFFIRWDFYKRYVEIKKYNEKRTKKIFFNFNVEKLYKDQNKYIYKCILDKIILKKNFIFETEKIIHNCLKSIKLNKNIKLN